jgi:hypothetical protein
LKHWQNVLKMDTDFATAFGTTDVFTESAGTRLDWKAAAVAALAPPEGLEASVRFDPVALPNLNATRVTVSKDPLYGTKLLQAAANAKEGTERGAIASADIPEGLPLTGMEQFAFRIKNTTSSTMTVSVIFFEGLNWFESVPVPVPTGSAHEIAFNLRSPTFKPILKPEAKNDQPLPTPFKPTKFAFAFTSKASYAIEIDTIKVR